MCLCLCIFIYKFFYNNKEIKRKGKEENKVTKQHSCLVYKRGINATFESNSVRHGYHGRSIIHVERGLPLNAYKRIRHGSFRAYSSHFLTIGYVEVITGTIRATTLQNCFHSLHENVHAIINIYIQIHLRTNIHI